MVKPIKKAKQNELFRLDDVGMPSQRNHNLSSESTLFLDSFTGATLSLSAS